MKAKITKTKLTGIAKKRYEEIKSGKVKPLSEAEFKNKLKEPTKVRTCGFQTRNGLHEVFADGTSKLAEPTKSILEIQRADNSNEKGSTYVKELIKDERKCIICGKKEDIRQYSDGIDLCKRCSNFGINEKNYRYYFSEAKNKKEPTKDGYNDVKIYYNGELQGHSERSKGNEIKVIKLVADGVELLNTKSPSPSEDMNYSNISNMLLKGETAIAEFEKDLSEHHHFIASSVRAHNQIAEKFLDKDNFIKAANGYPEKLRKEREQAARNLITRTKQKTASAIIEIIQDTTISYNQKALLKLNSTSTEQVEKQLIKNIVLKVKKHLLETE